MMTIEDLLMVAAENNASDVHITVGVPPKMRVNGELLDMDYPRLMPDDAEGIIIKPFESVIYKKGTQTLYLRAFTSECAVNVSMEG